MAADKDEFEIGQLLLDVDNGVIYAIRSENTTTTSDRIFKWSADTSSINLEFAVSSFYDNQSSQQLIGSGEWRAGTALTFNAAYDNGPATAAYISCGSWDSNLVLGGDFTGPVTGASTAQDADYPSGVGDYITFQLNATKSSDTDTASTSVRFFNERIIGLSTTGSGYDSDFLNDMTATGVADGKGGKVVTSGKNGTYTFTPSANDYLIVAYRKDLGTSTFNVGGFSGGMEGTGEEPLEITHTNSVGFTEPYYLYRSDNHSLGDPTVEMTIT